ncbi:MAG TPA: phosphatase PAP2 family protein [Miltoncostaeaceae bacterium]|nr:phosphatase PAP2 family protein [Miltoncostaeaceae bacterium]
MDAVHALSLAVMTLMLASGLWKSEPVLAVAVLVVSAGVWSGALRDRQPRGWWFVYVGGMYLYTMLRALADEYGLPVQVDYVIAIEEFIFHGMVPTVTLQESLFSPSGLDWLDTVATLVHWSFFVVPHVAAIVIWRRGGPGFSRYVLAVVGTLYAGLVIFFLLPTAPPWLASAAGEIPGVYRVIDFVGSGLNVETYRQLHASMAEPNSVASVPSIHMAVTMTLVLWARRRAPRLVPWASAYCVLMGLSLVYLGEHYAVDLLAGALVAAVVDVVVNRAPSVEAETPEAVQV